MKYEAIINSIKSQYNSKNIEGMARFGINSKNNYGCSIPFLRNLAKKIGKNHELALELWDSEIHDARLLAGFIDEPSKVSEKQIENWVCDFDSWDVCDLVCSNLFDQTGFAWGKAVEWTKRDEEFVKRAGFVLMAALSVHDKKAKDGDFEKFFPIIKRESNDERNFVRNTGLMLSVLSSTTTWTASAIFLFNSFGSNGVSVVNLKSLRIARIASAAAS